MAIGIRCQPLPCKTAAGSTFVQSTGTAVKTAVGPVINARVGKRNTRCRNQCGTGCCMQGPAVGDAGQGIRTG
ncbi:MAG: hypothetical protein LC657_07400 [Desulfobacteraceae bacterium]|nr:hypothetical protein [Desulfobacteraceae bacterium]